MPAEATTGDFRLIACNRDDADRFLASADRRSLHRDRASLGADRISTALDRLCRRTEGCRRRRWCFHWRTVNNRVEIAYFTLPGRQGEGIARRTARQLVSIPKSQVPEIEIFAKTMPGENASTRILQRLGFKMIGTAPDDEIRTTWTWLLR